MNKWFKKFPYPGWLLIFLVALGACVLLYHQEQRQYTPAALRTATEAYLQKSLAACRQDEQGGRFRYDSLAVTQPQLSGNYFLFLVRGSRTLSWNTTRASLPAAVRSAPDSFREGRLLRLPGGYYFAQCWRQPGGMGAPDSAAVDAFALIPLRYEYPIENQYFKAHFVAETRIPEAAVLSPEPVPGSLAIRLPDGRPVCYISFDEAPELTYNASPWVWLLCFVACFSLASWVHEHCYGFGKRMHKPLWGWLLLLLVLMGLVYILTRVPIPAGFRNAQLFSPELFSSGEEIKSLGHFLIETILDAWLLLYLLAYVPLSGRRLVRNRYLDKALRLIFVFGLVTLLYRVLADAMQKLVIDSKISFEVGDFRNLTRYTFIGIFTLSVITINFLAILGLINNLLQRVVTRLGWKLLIIILMSVACIYMLTKEEPNVFYIAAVCMAVAGLLLIDAFGLPLQGRSRQYDLSIAPNTYIWFAILCSWITLEIFYFNYSKEKELRKVFAQKQQQKDDSYVDYVFRDFAEKFRSDTVVRNYLQRRDSLQRQITDRHVLADYFKEYTPKYNILLYYFDRNRQPLQLRDGTETDLLALADSLHGSPVSLGVVNLDQATQGRHMYWLMCPITGSANDTLGYVGFDVSIEKRPRRAAQRSFLEKQQNPTDQQYYDNYAYAIYRKNRLWTQGGDYIFPYTNSRARDTTREFSFSESLHQSQLLYRSAPGEQIKVIYRRNLLTSIVSLFSYVLAMLLGLTAVVFLLRQSLFYPGKVRLFLRNFNFTIRSKVNLTILVTVFASLLVVGIITLSFLSNRYKENQRKGLQSLMLYYTQSIQHFAEENHWDFRDNTRGNLISRYTKLSYQLNYMSREQGADINLYDASGRLVATSQLELLGQGLLSNFMQPAAFIALRSGEQSELIEEDCIGTLHYKSVYIPLRDKSDNIYLYVNLPYYASETELTGEISNVLVSLINVYTLIFFISGICAILISNSIIRSFRLLIDQFRNIRLRHNEYIEWPYKDELGILVREYNTMMRKVEGMASKLARTEREAAWREIARQVAHEIKNPLTPMKLNIQYLQQAIRSGRPDIEDLASRVSVTLIEQIENLNLIASEFSNFAKMPEARPELLHVHQALQSLVQLFHKENETAVVLAEGDPSLYIYMDKSYFIRIFTNLIQNAIQSVDSDRSGRIVVRYEQKERQVVVSVEDNGGGIPEELQEKLFVPYFTTKSSGTGLGLPMTKSMVEHSGGNIWFATGAGGTVFYVQLPLTGAESDTAGA